MIAKKSDKKKLLKMPKIVNSRFLTSLLKIINHGSLDSPKMVMITSLMNMIDVAHYATDPELYTLLRSITISINCKSSSVLDGQIVYSTIFSSIGHSDNTEILSGIIEPIVVNDHTMTSNEIDSILTIVSRYSKIGFVLHHKESLTSKLIQIESGSIHGIETVIQDFEKEITDIKTKLHKVLSEDGMAATEPVFLNSEEFSKDYFKKVFARSKEKSRVLKMGLHSFNEFLSAEGGLLCGKMYLIGAPTNSFKTGLLLYIALWIQLYNSDIYKKKFEEDGKIPTILVLSLENTPDENTERLFSMYSKKNMSDVEDLKDAENIWSSNFYKTDSIIDICMVYGRNGRFSPADLEYRIDELESQGRIVIATIVDYLKIMRDDHASLDNRQKIINIASDLYSITVSRPHMCMVTAHHTNRTGDEMIADISSRGGVDIVKSLGRQHLTEAHGVEDAIDFSLFVRPEISQHNDESYLTFKKGKCRYKRTPLEYFAHHLRDRFHLYDDIHKEKSESILTINETESRISDDPNAHRIFSEQPVDTSLSLRDRLAMRSIGEGQQSKVAVFES